ncbi:MAG: hypothetical protein ACXWMO_03520, partial [Syntrophales bacterium]
GRCFMRGEVTFTMKEVTRYRIVQRVLEGKIVNREAASALSLSIIIQLLPSRNRSHFLKAKDRVNLWTNGT